MDRETGAETGSNAPPKTAWLGCCILPPLPPSSPKETRGKREPANIRLFQQSLAACQPVMDLTWILFIYMAIALVCIPLGAVTLSYGIKPVEVSQRYDQSCFGPGFNSASASNSDRLTWIYNNSLNPSATTCNVTLSITSAMPSPVYLLYEINGFQQNHLRYVWSRSETQLVAVQSPDITYCTTESSYTYSNGSSSTINPCGLTAWTFFNDSFTTLITRGISAPATLPLVLDGIAPQSDARYQFADYLTQSFNPIVNSKRGGDNITVYVREDSQFVIWMKLAPLPKFRKLYAIINQDLQAGDTVTISVNNIYNTFGFDGQKSVVLSTTTWMGSNNPLMGIAFLVTGVLSVILGIVYFIVATRIAPRMPGDLAFLEKFPAWADFASK